MIYAAIVACEIGFWVFLAAGLGARYLLRLPRVGLVLLACVPLVDLALLIFSVVDLRGGGRPEIGHALAAVYLAVTVVFGHRMVNWADGWFAYRVAAGARPNPPKSGPEHARLQRAMWLRHLLAYVLGCALLLAAHLGLGGVDGGTVLLEVARTWAIVLVIDFLWSYSYTLWPRTDGPT